MAIALWASAIVAFANIAMTLVLLGLYTGTYRKVKSSFTLGLLLFGTFFVVLNLAILVFWLFLPEDDEGSLQVLLFLPGGVGLRDSLHAEKLIDLRGKRGWQEVRLDLHRDFGNTRNVQLEDVRSIRIASRHLKRRTVYLDFVHLE